MLRAATACTFSTSQLLKVFRSWCVLYILTSKCASSHNDVQFFISHLTRWLRTRRFSEPTFRPSGATNHWKNNEARLFYLFAHLHLLSSDSFSSLIFSLLFSDSSHLRFPPLRIVGSLTSKLPSISIHSRTSDRDIIKKHMAIWLINPLFSDTTPIFKRFSVFIHFPSYLLMMMMMIKSRFIFFKQ